jgi:phage-related protein
MAENKMKDRIVEELKNAKEAGQITMEKVSEIVRDAVSAAVAETRGRIEDMRPIVKSAVTAAVEGLKEAEVDVKETVKGAVEGAIAGVRSRGDQAVEATRDELRKLEKRLEDEKTELAQGLRKGLEGAKEAGAALPEDVRGRVESAVSDIKLKSTELLGLTKQTVKEAVKQAIESGKDVKETVAKITSDAAEKALKEGRFSADRVKKIAKKVMSGAVEAAEETGKEIKNVAVGAFEGVQKGIASAVESVGDKTKAFVREDLARTKEDLEAIEGLFIETTRKVAQRSGDVAKDVLNDLADQTKKTTSVLREKARHATEKTTAGLKQAGKGAAKATTEAVGKAAHIMAEEAKELGKRSVAVAKGAITGMWKGAKDAIKKEKEEK